MKQFLSIIRENRHITRDYYTLSFDWKQGASFPVPGQFVTIRVSESTVPLLRRPFAFSGFDMNTGMASIIYQKRGPATEILAGKQTGDNLDILGPLGNTFVNPTGIQKCIIVAGGIGLGPMIYAASHFKELGLDILLIFGCRGIDGVPDDEIFNGIARIICTDDGSLGFKGTTVDYLNTFNENELQGAMLVCCGPTPMLQGCHLFAQKHGLLCQVSMEQVMACGVGACMGCVVKTIQEPGYARVCKDGPVFNSQDLLWT